VRVCVHVGACLLFRLIWLCTWTHCYNLPQQLWWSLSLFLVRSDSCSLLYATQSPKHTSVFLFPCNPVSAQDLSQPLKYSRSACQGHVYSKAFYVIEHFFHLAINRWVRDCQGSAGPMRLETGLTPLCALNTEVKNKLILQGEEEWPQNQPLLVNVWSVFETCKHFVALMCYQAVDEISGNAQRVLGSRSIGCINRALEHIGNQLPCLALIHSWSFRCKEELAAYFT